jgi:phenol 2-monooxygenase
VWVISIDRAGASAICCRSDSTRAYSPATFNAGDVRAMFQQAHRELAIEAMPSLLLPRKRRYGLRDYKKMFCADIKGGNDIFAMRNIKREAGCMVVMRPDQYVAHVLPLERI